MCSMDSGRVRLTWLPRLTLAGMLAISLGLTGCANVTGSDPGSRSFGTYLDDEGIERRAKREIRASDAGFETAHLVVKSFEGRVLLIGQVPSAELKAKAEETTRKLRKVKNVYNELEISGPISGLARSNDNWLSSKVNTQLLVSDQVDSGRIKVYTENGVVYMMGLVTRAEADAAVEVASAVYGVQKIVKLFEYIN